NDKSWARVLSFFGRLAVVARRLVARAQRQLAAANVAGRPGALEGFRRLRRPLLAARGLDLVLGAEREVMAMPPRRQPVGAHHDAGLEIIDHDRADAVAVRHAMGEDVARRVVVRQVGGARGSNAGKTGNENRDGRERAHTDIREKFDCILYDRLTTPRPIAG